jgi:hypothetical protein
VQHLNNEDRQQHGEGIAHQAEKRKKYKNGADWAKGTDIVPTFTHLFEHAQCGATDI